MATAEFTAGRKALNESIFTSRSVLEQSTFALSLMMFTALISAMEWQLKLFFMRDHKIYL